MADVKINSVKDVEKLLQGTHESQNTIQVGFEGEIQEKVTRKIGDKWTDSDGNEWEQKDGYIIKLGKEWQQELYSYLTTFNKCPKETCTCTMPKRLDEKMRIIHGMCFDCVVDMEHKIKLEGKWEEYEKSKVKENALAWLKEAERDKNLVAEELSKIEFANGFGDLEKWTGGMSKEQFLQKIEEEFEQFKKEFIEQLERPNDEST